MTLHCTYHKHACRRSLRAFSLIELLVVILIIAILGALSIPAFNNIAQQSNMTAVTESFAATVNLARQRSVDYNRQIAIRFWRDSNSGPYKSYQLWEQFDSADPDSWQAVNRVIFLPSPIVITENTTFSSLLANSTEVIAADGRHYLEAYFTPGGSIVAPDGQTSITFIAENGDATGGSIPNLPPNFGVVDIQPMTATPIIYRPQ